MEHWEWWCHRSRSDCTGVSSRHPRLRHARCDQTDDLQGRTLRTGAPQTPGRIRSHRSHVHVRWPCVISYIEKIVCLFIYTKTHQQKKRSFVAVELLLVWFLAVGAIGTFSTIVSLDGEAMFSLTLAVQGLFGTNETLTGGAVQHYSLKLSRPRTTRAVMNPEPTDLSYRINILKNQTRSLIVDRRKQTRNKNER